MLNELRAFLPMAEKVKARNPTMPILNHLCIENGAMRITDLETTVIIPVDDQRSFTLPISIMKQILKQRPAALEITPLENYQMKVLFDNNSVVFPILDVEEYPSIPKGKFKKIGTWTKEIFLQLYKQLDFVSKDELKPALAGVWIDQNGRINSCATDGHILEYIENLQQDIKQCKTTGKFSGIIPANVIRLMAKYFRSNIAVYVSENYIRFELPNKIEVYSRLIDEQYPEVSTFLKQDRSNEVKIKKAGLLKAIQAARPFSNPTTKLGILTVNNGTIAVNTRDIEQNIEFETHVPAVDRKGEELTVGFNMDYLEMVIKDIDSAELLWYYENAIRASIFRASQDDCNKTCLLMPVRLEEE